MSENDRSLILNEAILIKKMAVFASEKSSLITPHASLFYFGLIYLDLVGFSLIRCDARHQIGAPIRL
jgi:hypothetical protein